MAGKIYFGSFRNCWICDSRSLSLLYHWLFFASTNRKSIGRKVNVAYNPSDPNDAEVASAVRLYLGPLIVTALYAAYTYWYWTHGR